MKAKEEDTHLFSFKVITVKKEEVGAVGIRTLFLYLGNGTEGFNAALPKD